MAEDTTPSQPTAADAQMELYRSSLPAATDTELKALVKRGCSAEDMTNIGALCQIHDMPVTDVVEWFRQTKGTARDLNALVRLHCGPAELEFVKDMCLTYGTRPTTIVSWIEDTGATLEHAREAADLRGSYPQASGIALLRILVELDLQDVPLDMFMAPLEEAMDIASGEQRKFKSPSAIDFPVHHLIHVVDDQLGGDWHMAQLYASENPYGFAQLLLGRIDLTGFCLQYLSDASEVDLVEAQERAIAANEE